MFVKDKNADMEILTDNSNGQMNSPPNVEKRNTEIKRTRAPYLEAERIARAKQHTKNKSPFEYAPEKWGWKQELILLEMVQKHGLYSWELIAKLLTSRAVTFHAHEIRDHFHQYYVLGTLGKVWSYPTEEPIPVIDHTEYKFPDQDISSKYLPNVSSVYLKEIKYMPHRNEFEKHPQEASELMLSNLDFSSYYRNLLKSKQMEKEIYDLQMAALDIYSRIVAKRISKHQLMQKLLLIEQFVLCNKNRKTSPSELENKFLVFRKLIRFYECPSGFKKFFTNCYKEKTIKDEIKRIQCSFTGNSPPEIQNLEIQDSKAPFFLSAADWNDTRDLKTRKSERVKGNSNTPKLLAKYSPLRYR